MTESVRGWKYEIDPVFGCWRWTGSIDRHGYGIIWGRGGPTQAHRTIYLQLKGPIAPGLKLDHECRVRSCVNPDHLDPVTEAVNQQRRSWGARTRRAKCRAGHDLRVHGMVTEAGGIICRICQGPPK